jgi:hypothetical protein
LIFYTLFGPTSKLEIHDDKIKVMRNPFLGFFHRKDRLVEFKLNELAHFSITEPKFVWGKLQCESACGKKADFRFTTNTVMMGKIEKYLNTLITKNEKRNNPEAFAAKFVAVAPVVIETKVIEEVSNVLPFKAKVKTNKPVLNKKKIKNRKVA